MTGTATDRPGLQAHVYTKTQKKRLEKQAEALAAAWSARGRKLGRAGRES